MQYFYPAVAIDCPSATALLYLLCCSQSLLERNSACNGPTLHKIASFENRKMIFYNNHLNSIPGLARLATNRLIQTSGACAKITCPCLSENRVAPVDTLTYGREHTRPHQFCLLPSCVRLCQLPPLLLLRWVTHVATQTILPSFLMLPWSPSEQNRRDPLDGADLRDRLVRQPALQGGCTVRRHASGLLRRLRAVPFPGPDGGVPWGWG